ncbi:MAG TPA: hypothetical protein VGR25_01985 [bacterium]|jgi:hypothetical protein|nr:hypothetical protein [bacterium]
MRLAVPLLAAALLAAAGPSPVLSAPIPCLVAEGVGIGTIRIGMPTAEALRLTGSPAGRVIGVRAAETVYLFTTTLAQITTESGQVSRVATRHPTCVTSQGVRVGDSEARVRLAYERAPGSLRGRAGAVVRYVFPFTGVEFVLTDGRVTLIEVFRPDAVPARVAPPPPGTESAVAFRSLSGRVEGTTFVVVGSVSNAGPPLALFVQVVLLGPDGGRVGEGTTTLVPNPIGGGRAGSFEVRLTIDDVVARFIVTVRPMNRPTVALAEAAQDVKDAGAFTTLVLERLLEVTVLGATAERGSGTFAAVTNRSSLKITGLVVEIEMRRTCTVTPVGSTFPQVPRTFTDVRKGTVRVGELAPNARVEVAIDLAATGPCLGAGAEWQATWKVLSGKVEEAR